MLLFRSVASIAPNHRVDEKLDSGGIIVAPGLTGYAMIMSVYGALRRGNTGASIFISSSQPSAELL